MGKEVAKKPEIKKARKAARSTKRDVK